MGDKAKIIPLHILQQGGVLPIQAPVVGLGETAPMLLQAAGTPIDSGATAAARFSQIAQRRTEDSWRRYAFEVEQDFRLQQQALQKEGLGLEREKFEWAKHTWTEQQKWIKETWGKEYDMKERMLVNQENMMMVEMLNQLDTGVRAVLGEDGWSGAFASTKTPAQTIALTTAAEEVGKQEEALIQGHLNGDRTAVGQAFLGAKRAVRSTVPASIQAAKMMQQSAQYAEGNADGAEFWEYNPYYYRMKLMEMENMPVDVEPDMLVESIDKLIVRAVNANKDAWGFPQTVETYPGILTTLQQSPDMSHALKQYLRTDPTGSLQKEYNMRKKYDPRVRDSGMSFDDWVYDAVSAKVDAAVPRTQYKVNDVNTAVLDAQVEANVEGGGGGDYYKGGGTNEGRIWAADVQPYQESRLDFDIERRTEESKDARPWWDFGLFDEDTGPSYEGALMHWTLPDTEENNENMMKGASLLDQVSFSDYDPKKYINADRTLTEDGKRIGKALKKLHKEEIRVPMTVYGYDADQTKKIEGELGIAAEGSDVGDLIAANALPGDAAFVMEFTGDQKTGKMYSGDELITKFKGERTEVDVQGFIGKENPLPFHAMMQKKGGDDDPWKWGVNPFIITIQEKKQDGDLGEVHTFLLPRNPQYMEDFNEVRAQNQLYMRAVMGGGQQLRPSDTPEGTKEMMSTLMQGEADTYAEGQYAKQVEYWSDSFQAVELTGETTFDKGPHARAKQGDVMMTFNFDGKEGSVSLQDVAGASKAILMAESVANDLTEKDTYEIHQFYSPDTPKPVYALSINGEPASIIYDDLSYADAIDSVKNPVYKLQPQDPSNPLGAYGNFQAMKGVKEGVVMEFSEAFLDSDYGLGKLDQMIVDYNEQYGKNVGYIFTSGYRQGDLGEHGKNRAADWRNDRHLYDFFVNVTNGEFRGTPRGAIQPYWFDIPGTLLRVTLHDNRKDPNHGQHFDIRLRMGAIAQYTE